MLEKMAQQGFSSTRNVYLAISTAVPRALFD